MIGVVYNSKGAIKNTTLDKYNFEDTAWINVFSPSKEELDLLEKKTGISMQTLNHFLDNQELSRIEKLKDRDIIILKYLVDKKVRTLGVVKAKNYTMTMCYENINIPIDDNASLKSTDSFMKNLIYNLIKNFSSKLDSIDEEISIIEDVLFDENSRKDAKRILHIKKELMYIKKGLNSNKDVIQKMENLDDDLRTEMNEMIETENTLSSRITVVMEIYMTYTSNKLNETMKSFTVIASLLLLPTLIAGIYGMNLALPLQNANGSFYIVLGVMLLLMILMVFYFKYKKWV